MQQTPIIPGAHYQHYKDVLARNNRTYTMIGIGRHTETNEEVVVYQADYEAVDVGKHALWVRPLTLFIETVSVAGQRLPRFTICQNND